ncbi:MAG: DHH family phosphoesterase [Verrucomicrobia bacterium]|nr:DHH family phosphoesterase [Verrucomicrobiota bacterium]
MVELTEPKAIFTHESDLDGFVAGLLLQRLAEKLYEKEIPLYAYPVHAWRQRRHEEPTAWVCDLAVNPTVDRPGWTLIDHHPLQHIPAQATLIHSPHKSSSALAYELCEEHGLSDERLARLARLANVADLFLIEDPDFPEASDYANLIKTYQFWSLYRLLDGKLDRLLDHPLLEVMAVKRRVEDPIGYAWSRASMQPITPQVGYVETLVGNPNLILHRLLEDPQTPYEVLITLARKASGVWVASLRSRNGQAIRAAELLQGGGHPNAAAAALPRSIRRLPEAIAYLKKVLAVSPPPAAAKHSLADLFEAWDQKEGAAGK